jgi:NTP pyrophosphatase (non-canonical NTP hydrolase)
MNSRQPQAWWHFPCRRLPVNPVAITGTLNPKNRRLCCAQDHQIMHLSDLTRRAMELRARFSAQETQQAGRPWTREEVAQGFVGDVGDLMKLVMAKNGLRAAKGDVDERLAHELSDCLWSVLVLAELYHVDLEASFLRTMSEIEAQFPRQNG